MGNSGDKIKDLKSSHKIKDKVKKDVKIMKKAPAYSTKHAKKQRLMMKKTIQ